MYYIIYIYISYVHYKAVFLFCWKALDIFFFRRSPRASLGVDVCVWEEKVLMGPTKNPNQNTHNPRKQTPYSNTSFC